ADGNLWDNTLETLAKENKDVILRMPIIPNINDTKTHMEHAASIAVKYKNIKNVEIMPYHSIGADKWNQLGLEYSLKNLSTATPTQKDLWNAMLNDALSKAGWNT
ncbi:MAG: hypothetical protein MJ236_04700, partial [Clostridia bacterium]|nr:hypothetical protein [Clostridia bacterium]